jgi:hypothetical protein
MINVVANNADHFSALWAATLKNFPVVSNNAEQLLYRGLLFEKLRPHCKPLKEQ